MGLAFSNFHTFKICMVCCKFLQEEEPTIRTKTDEFVFIYAIHVLPAPCFSWGYFPVLPCCDDGLQPGVPHSFSAAMGCAGLQGFS